MRPSILLLDEPGAMLDPRGRRGIRRVSRELHEAGMTVIVITQHMDEALRADRVVVMDRGRIICDGPTTEVLVQVDLLRSLGLALPFPAALADALRTRGFDVPMTLDETVLEEAICRSFSSHVTLRYPGTGPTTRPAVDDLSLVVEDGEYLGVIGHTGSGKSTLALLMAGLMTATAGTLTVNGADLAERSARRALRRQVGIVFQYPEHQLFADTVADDVAFGPRALGFSPAKVAHAVDEALQRVDMELCTYGHRSPFDLSEGQMRRVAIAGVLAARPDILILDEPMAGLDPAGRAEIATLLRRLHDRGLTIVMVSHDMDDIASLADKVLVLRDGRRFAHGTPAEVFARQTELREIGLGVPHAARFAARLSARGIDVAAMVATPDALADALVAVSRVRSAGRSSDMALGQYYKADSFLHRMDPRFKILLAIVYMLVIFLADDVIGLSLVLAFLAAAIALSGVPLALLARSLRPVMAFVIFTFVVNLVFIKSGDTLLAVGRFTITSGGLGAATFLATRLFTLFASTALLGFTTSPVDLADGMEGLLSPFERFGVPAHDSQ